MLDKINKAAEVLNSFRIFPRLFIVMYMYLLMEVTNWFMLLQEPSTAQAALVSTLVGVGAAWFGLYCNSGTKK